MIVRCKLCPGDGVIRGETAGYDWPRPCTGKARKTLTVYRLSKWLGESPGALRRVMSGRARSETCLRVLDRMRLVPFWVEM